MLTSNSPIYQKSEVLFGLDQAKDAIAETGEMIVVEGQFDALAMHAAGFKNAVATSGTNFGSGHVKLFEDIAGDKKRSIIFSYDPDVAGVKAAESVYEMLKNSGIDLYAVSGESDLDPAEIYSKDNEEGLKTLIDNKLPMLEHLIERIIATGNISTIEGKIAAIRAITKLLSGVEDQGLVSQLVSKYAARLDTTEDSMMEAIAQNL
jgi:DNA primase